MVENVPSQYYSAVFTRENIITGTITKTVISNVMQLQP